MGKIGYLARCVSSQFSRDRFNCPNCGCPNNTIIDRKFIITQLRRCGDCKLIFRTPTDDPGKNAKYYESDYEQGFTTQVPTDEKLAQMKLSGFSGSPIDYSYYIDVIDRIGLRKGAKIFDYGCSWGYGSYQFFRAGFDVLAFEVGRSRAMYAESKLGVRIVEDIDKAAEKFAGQFDCFFSAHVIEHVPIPAQAFKYANKILSVGGFFVSFTPNGSLAHRSNSKKWSKLWGEVHPNFIDDNFLDSSFNISPRAVGSSPVKEVSIPSEPIMQTINSLENSELFFVARKTGDVWGR